MALFVSGRVAEQRFVMTSTTRLSPTNRLIDCTRRTSSTLDNNKITRVTSLPSLSLLKTPLPPCWLLRYSGTGILNLSGCTNRSWPTLCNSNSIMNYTTSAKPTSFVVQDQDDFKEKVLKNTDRLVLVDFFATWCGPCKLLGPRLEQAVANNPDTVVLAKVDVDELGDLAMEYNISSVPAVFAFRKGQVVGKFVGVTTLQELQQFIDARS